MYALSISYKNAPLDLRGLIAFSQEEQLDFEKKIVTNSIAQGCVVISTCNRMEIYISGNELALDCVEEQLRHTKGENVDILKKYFRRYHDEKAIEHLYRVVAGMDSMVVGEDEILGQVRDSYQIALEAGFTDYELNTIFQGAFTCAKKIKTETKLSKTSVSIGTLAASEVFHWDTGSHIKTVLLIGMTGKMGSIVFKNLLSKDDIRIVATVREHFNRHLIAGNESRVRVVPFKERYRYVDEADVVISVTSSPHYTITMKETLAAIHSKKNRLFIDLAVPRDVDLALQSVENVTLMDIDYYKQLAVKNNEMKIKEVAIAEDMIAECMDEIMKEMCFHRFMPDFKKYQNYMKERTAEQALFQIRDCANYQELKSFLGLLGRIVNEEE